jgi:hypothetical protein
VSDVKLIAACTCNSWGRAWPTETPPGRLRDQMRDHLVKHADRPDLHKIYLANNGSGYELQMDMVAIPE